MSASPELTKKIQPIALLVLDVDGVLTDGSVTYTSSGNETKSFNIKDGLGIKLLQQAGIEVGIITGRVSVMVERRAQELGITKLIQGREDKGVALRAVAVEMELSLQQIAYMGDDLPDISALSIAGFAIAPSDAHSEVLKLADWQTQLGGGKGAVREVCDFILDSRGLYKAAVNDFGVSS